MGKPCSYEPDFYYKSSENPYQYYKSHKNPYQELQVTQESVSGTTSHTRICIRYYKSHENPYQVLQVTYVSERAMKSKVCMVLAEMCCAIWLTLQGNVVH